MMRWSWCHFSVFVPPLGAWQHPRAMQTAACGHQDPSVPLQRTGSQCCTWLWARITYQHRLHQFLAAQRHQLLPPRAWHCLQAWGHCVLLRDSWMGSMARPCSTMQQQGPVSVPAGGSLGSTALPAAVLMEEVRNLQLLAPSTSLLLVSLEIQQQRVAVSPATDRGFHGDLHRPLC